VQLSALSPCQPSWAAGDEIIGSIVLGEIRVMSDIEDFYRVKAEERHRNRQIVRSFIDAVTKGDLDHPSDCIDQIEDHYLWDQLITTFANPQAIISRPAKRGERFYGEKEYLVDRRGLKAVEVLERYCETTS
jgi:hypothetical protein